MTHRDAPRAGRTTWRRITPVLIAVALLAALAPTLPAASASTPAARSDSAPAWLESHERDRQPARLDPSLFDDHAEAEERSAGPASAEELTIVVEATDAEAARAAIEEAGGTVETALTDRVQGRVSAAALEAVAKAPGVRLVREPLLPEPHGEPVVTSEGVAETQADDWHTGTFDGTGTKVAILDGGFEGYDTTNELGASVETDFSRCGGTEGTGPHGTAVAEIVHDMAPGATLRLVCFDSDVDYVTALGSMAANGVDVVNGSFGFYAASRGDGSGGPSTINGATAALRDQGILYVASAGNSGQRHYNVNAVGDPFPAVAFADPADSFSDFVNISDGDALEITVPAGGQGIVFMTWDAWPVTRQDFDLYVGNDTCGLVTFSEGAQDVTGGAPPREGVFIDLTDTSLPEACRQNPQRLELIVNRWAGFGTHRLDFFTTGDIFDLEHVTGGSLVDPGTSPAALSVGAHCVDNGAIQPYSSRGPTIDGRVKPDISGPDATASSVYIDDFEGECFDGFTGTSASAPHAAGAAALVLDANPLLDVAELQQLLMDRAQDGGTAGPDNTYGFGRLRLGAAGDGFRPVPQAFTGMDPTRLLDSRPGSPAFPGETGNRVTPLGPGGILPVRVRGGATGVPADAVAVSLNVTVTSPTSGGWVTVFPDGTPPNASNVNFSAGQTIAVQVTATVGSSDSVRLFNALGSTHLIVDVSGWYGPTGDGGPSTELFTPLASPARAMDTRAGQVGYSESVDRMAPVGQGQMAHVQLAGLGGVPADATTVMLNLTGITPTASTFVTAFPSGGVLPTASNLNPAKGQTVANLVVVPVGASGFVSFYNQLGNTHLAIDVVGYFRVASGAGYVALDPPTRNLDTRTGTGLRLGALSGNATFNLKVARYNGVPADADAVVLSAAAVSPTAASGWLTVHPGGSARPNASNVNFVKSQTIANAVLARFGAPGTVAFYNSSGSTHVISDVAGYFIDLVDVQLPPP